MIKMEFGNGACHSCDYKGKGPIRWNVWYAGCGGFYNSVSDQCAACLVLNGWTGEDGSRGYVTCLKLRESQWLEEDDPAIAEEARIAEEIAKRIEKREEEKRREKERECFRSFVKSLIEAEKKHEDSCHWRRRVYRGAFGGEVAGGRACCYRSGY